MGDNLDRRHQIRLWVPTPPSVNEMYSNHVGGGRSRIKTVEYRAWEKWAAAELMVQRPVPMKGKVTLDFFHGNRSPIADCSNYVKALEDLLVTMGIIEGDNAKCVQRITSCWVPNYHGSVVHITPWVEAAPAYLGFDAGVMGQAEASPLERFVKSPQTLGKARRARTGEVWATGRGAANKKKIKSPPTTPVST